MVSAETHKDKGVNKYWEISKKILVFDMLEYLVTRETHNFKSVSFMLDYKSPPTVVRMDMIYTPIFLGRPIEMDHPTITGLKIKAFLSVVHGEPVHILRFMCMPKSYISS